MISQNRTTICLFDMHYYSFHSLELTNNDISEVDRRKSKGMQGSKASWSTRSALSMVNRLGRSVCLSHPIVAALSLSLTMTRVRWELRRRELIEMLFGLTIGSISHVFKLLGSTWHYNKDRGCAREKRFSKQPTKQPTKTAEVDFVLRQLKFRSCYADRLNR